MRILFDDQMFKLQKFGGISRYFTELIYEINKNSVHKAICPISKSENIHYNEKIYVKKSIWDKIYYILTFRFSEKRINRYLIRKDKSKAIKLLKSKKIDVFVPTYYNPYFLPLLGAKPFVLNVYDMIHEIFPSNFPPDDLTIKYKKELIEKASRIIAISKSTKNDILKFYPHIDPSKIEVVHLAYSLFPIILDLHLPENYILFVGNRSSYKNFIFFFNAIAKILKRDKNLFLICAGGNDFTEEEKKLFDFYSLSEQVFHRKFKDFELATYYTKAKCFVFPSMYEGFGIPVLEAMSCGCPVILAHHSSFPEVAGDAGIYFEMNNKEDLRNKVDSILSNDKLRDEFSVKGLAQAKKFSWEKTSKECIKVFKSVISN